MTDPEHAVEWVELDRLFEIPQFALGAADVKLVIPAVNRQARRVVAAIFEPLEPL
jgi:hypothetical protein